MFHPVFGLSLPDLGWVPAPSYLLRRNRILKLAASFPKGRALEIGCGVGALLEDFSRMGFVCDAVESSDAAFQFASSLYAGSRTVTIHNQMRDEWDGAFDSVMAFEVLEHIEDDGNAVARWRRCLKPGGRLIISVPAHQSRWDASDIWAGHFRRYEKAQLTSLLEREGFEVEHFECYGFPLADIIQPLRAFMNSRQLKRMKADPGSTRDREEGTARSGVERVTETKLWPIQSSWLGVGVLRFFLWLQELFRNTDLGGGYIIVGKKK